VYQQIHRIDVAARLTIRREPHEAQHRHRLTADSGPADRGLVRARFLAAGLLAEPLLHKGSPQRSVWGVWPAVTKQDRQDRGPLIRLQQSLFVVGMGTRLGTGQEPGPQHRTLRAQRQDSHDAAGIGDAAGRSNRQWGDGVHDSRDQGQCGAFSGHMAARLEALRDDDIHPCGRRPAGICDRADLMEDLHARGVGTSHVRRRITPEEGEDGHPLF
jgi:hypothetical protein